MSESPADSLLVKQKIEQDIRTMLIEISPVEVSLQGDAGFFEVLGLTLIDLQSLIKKLEEKYGSSLGLTAMELIDYSLDSLCARVSSEIIKRSDSPSMKIKFDAGLQCNVIEEELVVGWQECSYLSRSVHFTHYVKWGGKVRDLVLLGDSQREFMRDVMLSNIGAASHFAQVTYFGAHVTAWDNIFLKMWVSDIQNRSTVKFTCEIYKGSQGGYTPVAVYESDASLTRVDGQGKIMAKELSDSGFRNFESFIPKATIEKNSTLLKNEFGEKDLGELIFKAPVRSSGGYPLWRYEFVPTFLNANLIGNMYFLNHFNMQASVADLYTFNTDPDLIDGDVFLKGGGQRGELIHLKNKVKYFREAMPFDKVYINMRLESLYEKGATVSFDYWRVKSDGLTEKLAIGAMLAGWGHYEGGTGKFGLIPWPSKLREDLVKSKELTEESLSRRKN